MKESFFSRLNQLCKKHGYFKVLFTFITVPVWLPLTWVGGKILPWVGERISRIGYWCQRRS